MEEPRSLLSLDIGAARIGVARASSIARIPEALEAIKVDGTEIDQIKRFIDEYKVDSIVVGLPQNLAGEDTEQTKTVREFVQSLAVFQLPLSWQNEALTSVRAEAELRERKSSFTKGEIDSLAAVYILEDYLKENQ